jgi:16S rRNA (guanine527-N7)-methyltransferase
MEYKYCADFIQFEKRLRALDIRLTNFQKQQFVDYYELLVECNKVMNLTAITEFSEVVKKHFIDSLSIVKILKPENEKIVDIGTGAGFPGIPIKIVFPQTRIILLDSLNKRITFLNTVIEKLHLKNITALHGRAEDFGRDDNYREKFDVCVSRAVAKLSILSEYCVPYVVKGGQFIAYKSGKAGEEAAMSENAIKLLGAQIENTIQFILPYTEIERTLVNIRKTQNTIARYPRRAGKPAKEPL